MSKALIEKLRAAHGRLQARDLAGAERLCGEILRQAPQHPDALHLMGVLRLIAGNAGDAAALIDRALEGSPRDAAIHENLGLARFALQNYAAAESAFGRALALGASHGLLHMRLGIALASQGKLAEAVTALREAAVRSPNDPDVLLNLGNTLAEQGQTQDAFACYHKLLAAHPSHRLAHFNLGNLYRHAGRLQDALASFGKALALAPDDADSHNNLGLVYEQLQQPDDAVSSYRRALARDPRHVAALNNLGNTLRAAGRLEEAVTCYERALAAAPGHLDGHVNLGIARAEQERYAEAQGLFEKALRLDPRSFEAHYNLGRLLARQGRAAEAIVHYQEVRETASRQAMVYRELGAAYRQLGKLDSAIEYHTKARELEPRSADAHYNLAETLKLQGRLDEAIASYETALSLEPDHASALGGSVHLRQHVCSWEGIEDSWDAVRRKVASGAEGLTPFSTLSMPLSAQEQLACAKAWARRELGPPATLSRSPAFDFSAPRARDRLRVGYLSWGFHRHATAYLAAELFELHDRSRFEVFAYPYGPDDGSAIRARIRSAAEHFQDVSGEAYAATAKRIYDDGIDVLVDLTGYTLGARPQILALRPAPVQVNWLGYPGTMGADCIDWIIADPYVIPDGQEHYYAEKVVRLPHCYQISDRSREVSERSPTREECGLPEQGFVFCCFNQAYKVLPETFALWMRVLQAVPQGVLWLAEANRWATENLRRAAAGAGIAPERLVFAPRKPLPEYLAACRLADLALDTFPYTSHTTASDALWMGCPLLTRAGETFASRVAGSILTSAGLEQCVAFTPGDYERMVVELALSGERLAALRSTVRVARDSAPLFDTPRFVQNLETAYDRMLADARDGRYR